MLNTSLCLGSNYGEEQTVISISLNKENTIGNQEEQEVVEQDEEQMQDGEVEGEEGKIAEKDDDGDSFTTAASSLSSVNVCKICHCGDEVKYNNTKANFVTLTLDY